MKIKLGDIVRDTITGFEGLAVGLTTSLSNVERVTINPRKVVDGKPIGHRTYDAPLLERIGDSEIPVLPTVRPDMTVSLGDVVRDPISGLEGVATTITTWLEGCVIVSVQPVEMKDHHPVEQTSFDERTLIIVKQKNPPAPPVTTGGPRSEPSRGRQ